MAHPRHEFVRQRFDFCCGYCGVSETDSGGELTVDRFIPLSAGGDDSDGNLVYACSRCNLYKGAFFALPSAAAKGQRLLHPLNEDNALHYREDAVTHFLIPLTITGETHIDALQLNRPQLIAHRRRDAREARSEIRLNLLETAVGEMRELIAALEEYARLLEQDDAK